MLRPIRASLHSVRASECVLETAEAVLDGEDLARVRDGLAGKKPRKAEEREQLVLRLLTERGRSSEQIAEQLSVKLTLVRRVIRQHRRKIVRDLLGQGLMLSAVADRLGFSDSFVRLAARA
jgi:DNA-binding NarL/FixJ family response regulator